VTVVTVYPDASYCDSALRSVKCEIDALSTLLGEIEYSQEFRESFDMAITCMAQAKGRVIVTGMGKSGLIGRKIAATLRSTGTPAVFLHPGEASHGDLGLITDKDVVFALTWSGKTAELKYVFAFCHRLHVPVIVATTEPEGEAARSADICIRLPVVREACPYDLAPTSSTTVQLVLGDAVAVALLEARGLTPSQFHSYHPGGALGALLLPVKELMGTGDSIPQVSRHETVINATVEMSRKRYGATAVMDDAGKLVGVFTDGDLRRCISIHDVQGPIGDYMSSSPVAVSPSTLCSEVLRIMNDNAIAVVFVIDQTRLVGVVHMHDLVRATVA
jgi:arabinose-5-phosphate isomerase